MTLLQLISRLEQVAKQQPSVNMIVRSDVFRLNSAPSLKYGVFAWVQGQHTATVDGSVQYNFSLIYVDRLLNDESNQVEIHSVGCETIQNILRTMVETDEIEVGSYTIQAFNQRFTDSCAGVFANVTFTVYPTAICAESFEQNDDQFLTY